MRTCIRIYAATMRNIPITIVLVSIVIPHFAVGVWEIVLAAREGGRVPLLCQKTNSHKEHLSAHLADVLPIPLDAFRVCSPMWHRALVVSYISISLVYGAREPS